MNANIKEQTREGLLNLETAYTFLENLMTSGRVSDGATIVQTVEMWSENRLVMRDWGTKDACGTRACLGGWLTTCEELRAKGLRAYYEILGTDGGRMSPMLIDVDTGKLRHVAESNLGYLLDLDREEEEYIFSGGWQDSFILGLIRMHDVLRAHRLGETFREMA